MTTGTQSSTNPQQLLGDAIAALRATQPENAVLLARQAVELGLDDTTVLMLLWTTLDDSCVCADAMPIHSK